MAIGCLENIFIAMTLKIKAGMIEGKEIGKGISGQTAAETHPVIRPAAAPDAVVDLL